MTAQRVVRERIDPRLTASLFANYRTADRCAARAGGQRRGFARRRAGRCEVDLAVRPGSIVLTAVGGTGMGPTRAGARLPALGRLAQAGRRADRAVRAGRQGGHRTPREPLRRSRRRGPATERAIGFEDADLSRPRAAARLRAARAGQAGRRRPGLRAHRDRRAWTARSTCGGCRARLAEVYRPLLEAGDAGAAVDRAPSWSPPWALGGAARRSRSAPAAGWSAAGTACCPTRRRRPSEPGVRIYHLGRLVGVAGVVRPSGAGAAPGAQPARRRGGAAARAGDDEQERTSIATARSGWPSRRGCTRSSRRSCGG